MGRPKNPRSNPNFAGLVSRKMKRLWDDVKLTVYQLRSLGHSLQTHRSNYHTFYQKWAKKAPMSLQEWSIFWAEFRALEGELQKWYDSLSVEVDKLITTSDEGQAIVANHERIHPDDFIDFSRSLSRIETLLGEAKMVFATHGFDGTFDVTEEE